MAFKGLFGSFTHKLDSKGRMVLPASFRDEMGAKVVATISTNFRCIALRSDDEWEKFCVRLESAYQQNGKLEPLRSIIFGFANPLDIDSAGRILVPVELRNRLKIGSEVSVNGNKDHIQIWDTQSWSAWCDEHGPRLPLLTEEIPGL